MTMSPLRKAASRARRLAKAQPSDESRAIYRSARNTYFQVIEKEKLNSWRCYLSTVTVDTLFQAKRYASGPRPSALISTLTKTNGQVCVSNEEKAHELFHATCVATAPCDLNDAPPQPFPRLSKQSATYLPPPSKFLTKSFILESIKDTHPLKAPGPDNIQTWVWSLAWEVMSSHLFILFRAIIATGHIPSRWKVAKRSCWRSQERQTIHSQARTGLLHS